MNSEIALQAGRFRCVGHRAASMLPSANAVCIKRRDTVIPAINSHPPGNIVSSDGHGVLRNIFRRYIMDIEQVNRLENRQKVMKSRVKDIGEKMRDISSTVTGYKVMTTSLIIGFTAAMLFISGLFFAVYVKLTDVQSTVAVIPALQADIKQLQTDVTHLQSDMTLVKEKLEI